MLRNQLSSDRQIRILGTSTDGGLLTLTEEDRESHIHILGAPGEGKSKFLEMMVSMDIDALISGKSKAGACFIDSSDNGNTMKKVLKYCAHRGFEKVLLIDPHNIQDFGYVVPINPINYKAPSEAIQSHITDSMRVLWNTKDFSDEAIITTYLPHVVDAIHSSGMTLPDSKCLTNRDVEYASQRAKILGGRELSFDSKLVFKRVYTKEMEWREFQSSCRRLNPFYHSVMKQTLGSVQGVDFKKLLTEGWIILVNLYKEGLFEERHQRLLGTLILNEIILAMSRLKKHNPSYNIPYYIYIDEFGKYATRKVAEILYYSRQSGIRMNLAHQEFEQIDKSVMSAVKSAAKTKVLFYVVNPDDRHQMVRQMYGGELADRAVEFTLSQTKKQNAVIKINKQPPTLTRLKDWPDAPVSNKELKDFINKLYTSNPEHYRPLADVNGEIDNRFAVPNQPRKQAGRTIPNQPEPASKVQPAPSAQQTPVDGEQLAQPDTREDTQQLKGGSVFNNIPDSESVLRKKSKRATSKRNPKGTEAG